MLDATIRPLIEPVLNRCGCYLASRNISANTATYIGFISGLISIALITQHHYHAAVYFLMINRVLDGLDGAIARHTHLTDFGGFLDIVCDFIIYAGIVFAFGLADPENLPAALFLIFSFIGPITSFLGYAIIAAKKDITTTARGQKSFYHLGGICEGTETAFVLVLMCVLPALFSLIAYIYGALCWLTTIGRVYQARVDF